MSNTKSTPTDYKFEGWVGEDPTAVNGEMVWKEFEPKPWEETDIDIKVTHCGMCGTDLHFLRNGFVRTCLSNPRVLNPSGHLWLTIPSLGHNPVPDNSGTRDCRHRRARGLPGRRPHQSRRPRRRRGAERQLPLPIWEMQCLRGRRGELLWSLRLDVRLDALQWRALARWICDVPPCAITLCDSHSRRDLEPGCCAYDVRWGHDVRPTAGR